MPGPTFAAGSLTYIADLNTLSNAILTMRTQGLNYTAARGFWDILTANALSVTLPASPSAGDLIRISPASSAIVSVTFLRNGSNIDSVASDVTLSGTDKTLNVWLVYVDVSRGWRIIQYGAVGGLAWGGLQALGFTAVKNTVYGIDASTITATLPASAAAGDQVRFIATTDARVALTLGRNGLNINSAAADYVTGTNRFDITATYMGASIGWRVTGEDSNVKVTASISAGVLTLDARGGLVTKFSCSLNANITSITYSNFPPSGVPYRGEIEFTADGTQRTLPADAATFRWDNGLVPTPTSTNGKHDRYAIETSDAATNVHWGIIGRNYAS